MKRILFLLLIPFILYGQIERSSSGGIVEIDTTKYSTVHYVEGRVASIASSVSVLASDKTVNLDSSMDATEIQDSINAQPKNLNGYALTFQFADGTYNFDSTPLLVSGFVGGTIFFSGNAGESGLHTNQAVIFNYSLTSPINIISTSRSAITIAMSNIRINVTTNTYTGTNIIVTSGTRMSINGCYFYRDAQLGEHIYVAGGIATLQNTYTTNGWSSMTALSGGKGIIINSPSTGTNPNYGLISNNSIIFKEGSIMPTCITANELKVNGGQIFGD